MRNPTPSDSFYIFLYPVQIPIKIVAVLNCGIPIGMPTGAGFCPFPKSSKFYGITKYAIWTNLNMGFFAINIDILPEKTVIDHESWVGFPVLFHKPKWQPIQW